MEQNEVEYVEAEYVVVGDIELQLLADYVLIKPDDPIIKTAGGILLAGGAEEIPDKGIVVARGPGRHTQSGLLVKTLVDVGDYILFKRSYTLFTIKILNEDYLVIAEDSCVGKIRNKS